MGFGNPQGPTETTYSPVKKAAESVICARPCTLVAANCVRWAASIAATTDSLRSLPRAKSRFLAEFTLSPFASLRAVRQRRANGLGMTREGIGMTVDGIGMTGNLRLSDWEIPRTRGFNHSITNVLGVAGGADAVDAHFVIKRALAGTKALGSVPPRASGNIDGSLQHPFLDFSNGLRVRNAAL